MKKLCEVNRCENPSDPSTEKEPDLKFKLPEDPEAERDIKLEGLTTNELLDMCFQGIDLKTYSGDAFTRSFLVGAINSAISTAEMTFDISLGIKDIEDEYHDVELGYFSSYSYTPLNIRPVREVTKVDYMFGNRQLMRIPNDWVQIHSNAITIFPTSGILSMQMNNAGFILPYMAHSNYLPNGIRVSYKAGIKKEDVPYNLIEYIFKTAANSIFEVWGDQIIGAGIASSSISLDGVSESIGTTQSAMYGGASARILEYRKDLDALTVALRRYFSKWNMAVL